MLNQSNAMGLTANRQQLLDAFLAGIEKRAFKIAEFAVNDRDEALDLVQNAMYKLVQRYSIHDPEQWTLLFFRILQNEIKDWKRKAWIRGWFGYTEHDTEQIVDASITADPGRLYRMEVLHEQLQQAIRNLPYRQQQAFLLRSWENLDVKQTAQVMNCSTGSVKTHYARAISRLREQLAGG
jgi:RNA polymerase sigma-70 factor, ECF subfamily